MTSQNDDAPERRRPGWVWPTAIIAAVLIIVAIVVAVTVPGGQDARPDPSASPSPTASAEPEPRPTPEPTPSLTEVAPEKPAQLDLPLDATAEIQTQLRVRLSSIEAVEGEALGPGEVGGPAIRVSVEFSNDTNQDVSLATAVVNAYYGANGAPANPVSGPGATPFPTTVPAGGNSSGVFVFTVPVEDRNPFTVEVDYSVETPTVLFAGDAPASS